MREIAHLVGMGNRMRFEHSSFHSELYKHLRFSKEDVEHTRDGLDVATLQLPPGVASILAFLRTWRRMRLANLVGFSRSVGRQAAQELRHSGAIGVLTVEEPSAKNFVIGGRALQRLWLTATSLGLGLHPTASLPIFLAYDQRRQGAGLLPKHGRMARQMTDRFYKLMPETRGRPVQMAFRLGYANPPAVRSLRRPPDRVLDLT